MRAEARQADDHDERSPASVLAWILYEQGQLEEAEELLRSRLPAICAISGIDCVVHAYRILARIAARSGDRASAMATLDDGCTLAESRKQPRLLAAMLEERIRLCEPGQEARAAAWLTQLRNLAERHRPVVRCAQSDIGCHLSRAKLTCFFTFRTGASPRPALAHLRHDACLSQDLHALSWANLAEAQVLWIEGDHDGSVACVAKALRTAEATSLRQQLVDAGPLLPPIIAQFLRGNGIERNLLAFTICAADAFESGAIASKTTPSQDKGRRVVRGGDSLTMREQDVLKPIGQGRTNKMIAQTQGVAPETVKTHVKNIFAKLGVERRAQAVVKAQRLGLLEM